MPQFASDKLGSYEIICVHRRQSFRDRRCKRPQLPSHDSIRSAPATLDLHPRSFSAGPLPL